MADINWKTANLDQLKQGASDLTNAGKTPQEIATLAKDNEVPYQSMNEVFGDQYRGLLKTTYGIAPSKAETTSLVGSSVDQARQKGVLNGMPTGATQEQTMTKNAGYADPSTTQNFNSRDYKSDRADLIAMPTNGDRLNVDQLYGVRGSMGARTFAGDASPVATTNMINQMKSSGYSDSDIGTYLKALHYDSNQLGDIYGRLNGSVDANELWNGYGYLGNGQYAGDSLVKPDWLTGGSVSTSGTNNTTPSNQNNNAAPTQQANDGLFDARSQEIMNYPWTDEDRAIWQNATPEQLQTQFQASLDAGDSPYNIGLMAASLGVPAETLLSSVPEEYANVIQQAYSYLANSGNQQQGTNPPGTNPPGTNPPGTNSLQNPNGGGENGSSPFNGWGQPADATPALYTVDPTTQTVQGQMNGLLGQNSQYMQLARQGAMEQANQAGLLNSTLAGTAGERAAIGSALPIAQQDAQTYFSQANLNQNAENTFALHNNENYWNDYFKQVDFNNNSALQRQKDLSAYDRAKLSEEGANYRAELTKDLNVDKLSADSQSRMAGYIDSAMSDFQTQYAAFMTDPDLADDPSLPKMLNFLTTNTKNKLLAQSTVLGIKDFSVDGLGLPTIADTNSDTTSVISGLRDEITALPVADRSSFATELLSQMNALPATDKATIENMLGISLADTDATGLLNAFMGALNA